MIYNRPQEQQLCALCLLCVFIACYCVPGCHNINTICTNFSIEEQPKVWGGAHGTRGTNAEARGIARGMGRGI